MLNFGCPLKGATTRTARNLSPKWAISWSSLNSLSFNISVETLRHLNVFELCSSSRERLSQPEFQSSESILPPRYKREPTCTINHLIFFFFKFKSIDYEWKCRHEFNDISFRTYLLEGKYSHSSWHVMLFLQYHFVCFLKCENIVWNN